jgi:hypothetical protein
MAYGTWTVIGCREIITGQYNHAKAFVTKNITSHVIAIRNEKLDYTY